MNVIKRFKKTVVLTMIAMVALVVAGCQALNGLDFNAMLKQSLSATAYEGTDTVEFKLLPNADAAEQMSDEEKKIFDLISTIKLQLNDVKATVNDGMSASGTLSLGDKRIGFKASMNDKAIELDLDGAKSPIVLNIPSDEAAAETEGDQAGIVAASKTMFDAVTGYAIDNLPNPSHLSVVPGQHSINGNDVVGMDVHAELTGKELWTWLKSYLDALLADKDGLKAMLSGLYDAVKSQSAAIEGSGIGSDFGELPDDKDQAIDDAIDEITDELANLKDEFAKTDKENADELDALLTDGTYVKGDVFVDAKLDVRRAVIEAAVQFPQEDSVSGNEGDDAAAIEDEDAIDQYDDVLDSFDSSISLFKGISLKLTSDRWNVNGDVKPVLPTMGGKTLNADDLSMMEGYDVLRQFDKNSVMYDLLRNQAHISKQTVELNTTYSRNAPIITPSGISLVPLRYTAEAFGATVTKSGGMIIVADGGTNAKISLKVGSSNAIINGKTANWSFPTTVVNGVTYVAARDFSRALGAQISWDNSYGMKFLVLTREL